MDNMVDQYGMEYRYAGVFPLSMSVMDAEENSEKTIQRLIEQGREAIKRGAEVLILGCAGMTGYHEPVSKMCIRDRNQRGNSSAGRAT